MWLSPMWGDPTTSTQPLFPATRSSLTDRLVRLLWKDERELASLWRRHSCKWKMAGCPQIYFCLFFNLKLFWHLRLSLHLATHRSTTVLIKHLSHIQSRGGSETRYSSDCLLRIKLPGSPRACLMHIGISSMSSKGNINIYLTASN